MHIHTRTGLLQSTLNLGDAVARIHLKLECRAIGLTHRQAEFLGVDKDYSILWDVVVHAALPVADLLAVEDHSQEVGVDVRQRALLLQTLLDVLHLVCRLDLDWRRLPIR